MVVENKDFENLIRQYDREDTFFYCDPPYYDAECYEVAFPKPDHIRLHDRLTQCQGKVMVSYNYCPFILDLYQDFSFSTQNGPTVCPWRPGVNMRRS